MYHIQVELRGISQTVSTPLRMRGPLKRIADLPLTERPRERLQERGPEALSDLELMSVLLGNGTRNRSVMGLAEQLLKVLARDPRPSMGNLRAIEGIGPAKAALLCAALEFARRRIRPEGFKIEIPVDILPLIRHYAERRREHLICVSLNGALEVLATRVVSVGLVDRSPAHPREVFAEPIADRASSIILAHNHPAGTSRPSPQDIRITERMRAAGQTLGIGLLDHIIFTRKDYYSFHENGNL